MLPSYQNAKLTKIQCNCHEKQSPKAAIDTADINAKRRRVAVSDRTVLTPELIPNDSPSSASVSPFSNSLLDTVSFDGDVGIALPSLEDLHGIDPFTELGSRSPMETVLQEQYVQKEPAGFASTMDRHPVNVVNHFTNLQPGARSHSPGQDAISDTSLQVISPVTSNTATESTERRTIPQNASSDVPVAIPRSVASNLPNRHSQSRSLHRDISDRTSSNTGTLEVLSVPILPVSSASAGVEQVARILSTPQVPSTTPTPALPTALSQLETANSGNLHFRDGLQTESLTVMQQNFDNFVAMASAVEFVSQVSSIALQTLQVILALRPHLFQFLSEQVPQQHNSEKPSLLSGPPFYTISKPHAVCAGLVECS